MSKVRQPPLSSGALLKLKLTKRQADQIRTQLENLTVQAGMGMVMCEQSIVGKKLEQQNAIINALAILGISIEDYKPPIMKMLGNDQCNGRIEIKQ